MQAGTKCTYFRIPMQVPTKLCGYIFALLTHTPDIWFDLFPPRGLEDQSVHIYNILCMCSESVRTYTHACMCT